MNFVFTPYSLPSLAGALGAAGLAVFAWSRRNRSARIFALMSLAGAVWALAYTLEVAGVDEATKLFWARAQYAGLVSAPVAWAAFTFQFTGRDKWLMRRSSLLVAIVPALTLLLVFTPAAQTLVWREIYLDASGPFLALRLWPGPWAILQVAYSYALNLLASVVLVLMLVRAPSLYRGQGLALLAALIIPWVASIIDLFGLSQMPGLQMAPAALALSAAIVAWGVYRFRLLDLLPVARDAVVDASGDGLVVLDPRHRVVDLNPAAQQILGLQADQAIGKPAAQVLGLSPDLLGPEPARGAQPEQCRGEVDVGPAQHRRTFDLFISPLSDARGRYTGRLIALRDITALKHTETQLRAQKELFQNLVAVARATSEGPTLQDTLQNALNVAAALTGAESGSLFLLNQAGEVTHSLLTYGGITPDERNTLVQRVMDRGLAGWVVRRRQAVLINDTARDERWLAPAADVRPVASALVVPILSGSALAGVLTLTHSRPNCFSEEHLNLMQAAADQLALALRNAQIYEAQRLMAQRQATLYGVLRAVGEQHQPEAVARAAVQAIVKLVGSQATWPEVSIALPDRDRRGWTSYAARGQLAPIFGRRLPMEKGIIGRAFRTGQPQYAAEVHNDPDYVEAKPGSRSELAVPVRHGERVLGVLNLESDRSNAFTPEDVLLAESLADAVALALDNANLYQAISDERSRLRALIETNRDGIFMVSMDRRCLVINAPVLRLLKLPGRPEDWVGQPIMALLPLVRRHAPHAAKALIAELRRLQRGDEPPAEGVAEMPEQTVYWLSLPVLAGDVPLGRLIVLRDVTEARLVTKLREELADTMVHDLRNPLTNIRMALELLEQVSEDVADPQQRAVLRIARSSTDRMLGLVNAILDVSRLESGQVPLDLAPVSLRDLTAEVFQMQRPLAGEKQLGLNNGLPVDLPRVMADMGLIRRVLENLVGNAVKFTPDGGQVWVSGVSEPDAERVVVTVRDNGPGLAPDLRHSVFQKFVTGRHRARGSGLGLAFCRQAVEAHGGRIWVDGEAGQGAVFRFSLPVKAGTNGRP